MIEAKLDAPLGEHQLRRYADLFLERSSSGLLLVMVPSYRAEEVAKSVRIEFSFTGNATAPSVAPTVIANTKRRTFLGHAAAHPRTIPIKANSRVK